MQFERADYCELHKQPILFVCRNTQKCLAGYYAFGCADCLSELGLHRHSHAPKFRQSLEEFIQQINTFFYEDPNILELIEQTKASLASYRKENKFYKEHYNRLFDLLRVKAISRLPKEGSEELSTLLDIKESRLCKIKQSQLGKLEGLKQSLLKRDSNSMAQRRYLQLREPISRIVRKFRINYQRSNPDLHDMIRVERQLQQIQNPKPKQLQITKKDECPAIFKAEGNARHLFSPLDKFDQLLGIKKVQLEVMFDSNLELRIDSYKLILGVLLNEAYNISSLRLTVTDAFLSKDKVALIEQFLVEMSHSGQLKQFTFLNRDAISGVRMTDVQQQLRQRLPSDFTLRVAYFYS